METAAAAADGKNAMNRAPGRSGRWCARPCATNPGPVPAKRWGLGESWPHAIWPSRVWCAIVCQHLSQLSQNHALPRHSDHRGRAHAASVRAHPGAAGPGQAAPAVAPYPDHSAPAPLGTDFGVAQWRPAPDQPSRHPDRATIARGMDSGRSPAFGRHGRGGRSGLDLRAAGPGAARALGAGLERLPAAARGGPPALAALPCARTLALAAQPDRGHAQAAG